MADISDRTKKSLALGACVIGVLLLAWWAAAAGPIQHEISSAAAPAPASYGSPNDSSIGSGIYMMPPSEPGTGTPGSADNSTPPSAPVYVPPAAAPQPYKCVHTYGPGNQPYSIYCPVHCALESYPVQSCCQGGTYLGGAQILCRNVD
jgi:hypothetical protein